MSHLHMLIRQSGGEPCMTCEEQIYSNEYFDFIVETGQPEPELVESECMQPVDTNFKISYVRREGNPPLSIQNYLYSSIPKCFALLDQSALEVSGILRMQNQPTLSLTGQGVLMGFLDTGIAYDNLLFRYPDGSTRIGAIWDQTIAGAPPDGFLYGTEYTREAINEALAMEDPYERVPSRDGNGHGTFVAGVAAGGADYAADFIGAAPDAELAVVKLKQAKPYLREFYFIPDEAVVYAENDIMTAVAYLRQLAERKGKPLVICIAVGTNMGSHGEVGSLGNYLREVGIRSGNVIVTAAGNEANARHHYFGRLEETVQTVEMNVEANVNGFIAEVWARAPERYALTVTSPTGESITKKPSITESHIEYRFLFENTFVTIDYRQVGRGRGDQLIYVRFYRPTRGIWSLQIAGIGDISEAYHIWLPMREMVSGEVFFLRSNPDTTITVPSTEDVPITVGAYDARDGSLYIGSGRGYTVDGRVKPDFTAPGVNVYGPEPLGNYVTRTGTSAAAAVTAGACAQFLEWAVVEAGFNRVNTVETKNFLIRGARRESGRSYPNREWGYGKLDIYNAFDVLREV